MWTADEDVASDPRRRRPDGDAIGLEAPTIAKRFADRRYRSRQCCSRQRVDQRAESGARRHRLICTQAWMRPLLRRVRALQ